jgi:heme-degrading monooxygenase HmoA
MASVLLAVKVKVRKDQEEAFNRWYNEEHIPDFLRFKGAVGARRYKAVMGEDAYQWLSVLEFQDEAAFRRWLDSDHRKEMAAEFEARFGAVTERVRSAWTQIWP